MSRSQNRFQLFSLAWLGVLLTAGGFLVWTNWMRIEHVEHVTLAAQEPPKLDATSATGYKDGTRELIIPEHNYESYNWIAQAQLMLWRGEWRLRHVDYENAPFGRETGAASPYRWWMIMLGWFDHQLFGRPLGAAIERTALYSDPLLHFLFLIGSTLFVWRKFGGFAASLVAAGMVAIFPFGGDFLPGAPSDRGIAQIFGLCAVLLLIAGITFGPEKKNDFGSVCVRNSTGWFFAAGVIAGLGSWISVIAEIPIILGVTLGAIGAIGMARRYMAGFSGGLPAIFPWRAWSLGISGTILVTYLTEYFPSNLGEWNLRSIHPVFGIACLGAGEMLTQFGNFLHDKKSFWKLRPIILTALAFTAIATVPIAIEFTSSPNFLSADLPSHRLTLLSNGVTAISLWTWLVREGFTLEVWSVLAPLLLIVPVTWDLVHRKIGLEQASRISIALGPVIIAFIFACRQLNWWNNFDAVYLALLVAGTATSREPSRSSARWWIWGACTTIALGLGAFQLFPKKAATAANAFTQQDVEGLIDRDLAHWLLKHTSGGKAVVVATPKQTAAMHYYGGFRGLGTLDLENREGLGAVVRIVSATTPEEALEMVQRREVRYFVIPSWDSNLDELATLGLGQVEGSFVDRLHHWALPNWLRPVAYQMPKISGFESQSISVFEVVDNQSDPTLLSRIAEYFVEMGDLKQATAVAQALKRFPADFDAQVASLDVELAVGGTSDFEQSMNSLVSRLARKADRTLPWDRRVALAIVLARGKQMELAKVQVRRCMAEIDDSRLRALTTGSLYRLLVLGKAFNLEIANPQLRELALSLIPIELREHIDH